MEFGTKLKNLRQEKKLTQQQVGEILHVSRATISSWEVGRTYPDLELLVQISDFYQISLDILLREDEKMVKTISQEIKNNRKVKHWLIGLIVIFVLWIVGSFTYWKYPIFNHDFSFTSNQITQTELKNKELTVELTKENWRTVRLVDEPKLVDGTLYIQITQKLSLFSKNTLTVELDNYNSYLFNEIEQIVLITSMNESNPQAFTLSTVPEKFKKVVWENK